MFILNSSDVGYCHVSDRQGKQTKILPGISYRGFLFAKVASYSVNQLSSAIDHCQRFLDLDEPVPSLVVKESNSVSVWSHHQGLKLLSKEYSSRDLSPLFTASEDLEKAIKPGSRLYFSFTGDTYQVLKLEKNGAFVKTKNLITGHPRTFSLAEITYQATELEIA